MLHQAFVQDDYVLTGRSASRAEGLPDVDETAQVDCIDGITATWNPSASHGTHPMSAKSDAVFLEGNLMRHVTFMSLTTSIGLMAIFAVDLIDIYFISRLGQDTLAAAAGYASAIMFFTSSVNIGLSIAAGVVVAKALGANNTGLAQELATVTALISIAIGVATPLIILPNSQFLLEALGAQGEVADLAKVYLHIIIPFTFLSGLSMVAVAVLRAHGEGRWSMYPLLVGGLVNVILDPLLIFTLDMGLHGAAWATVAARAATLLVALYPIATAFRVFGIPDRERFCDNVKKIGFVAIPAILTNVATPVGSAIVTREMAQFGADAVAAMAVIGRLSLVAFAGVYALSAAIGPIIGQNFGAFDLGRVKQTFLNSLLFLAGYVIVVSALLFGLSDWLIRAFDVQTIGRELLVLYCGPLALASIFLGTIFVANATFNNLGHPTYSTVLNWGLNTLGTWPFVILGKDLMGAHGVLIGQVVGTCVFASLALWVCLRVLHNPQEGLQIEGRWRSGRKQQIVAA